MGRIEILGAVERRRRWTAEEKVATLDLRQEMAQAIRKAELEPRVAQWRAELAGMHRPEEHSNSEATVAGWWPWVMGLGVVVVATFGTVIFASVEAVPPAAANSNSSPAVPAPAADPVVVWAREFRSRNGRNAKIPELQSQFPEVPRTTAWRRTKSG